MPAPVPTSKNPETKTIMRVYGAFVAALLLSLAPDPVFAFVALLIFTGVMIAAYMIRKRSEEDSLTENHMTWIIRTIWIVCLFALVTVTAGSFYLWSRIDFTAIQPCAEKAGDLIASQVGEPGTMELLAIIEPCEKAFVQDNRMPLIMATAIAALPLLLYLVLRLTKGIARAAKGYRLADIKSWF